MRTISIHIGFTTPGEAYDQSQTDENIHDGDILVCTDGSVAILVKAWPTLVKGPNPGGAFHTLHPEKAWDTIEGGFYRVPADLARKL